MEMGEKKILERDQFTIRPYQKTDRNSVLEMWSWVFGKQLSESLWRWKYDENPYGHNIMLSVLNSGEILAFFGGFPCPANWDGKQINMLQPLDVMSHPDYRGGGFFIRTVNAFIDTYTGAKATPLLYGFPGKQHFDIGEKYLQYQRINDGAVYLVAEFDNAGNTANHFAKEPAGVFAVKQVDGAFDRLWEQCRPYYPLAVKRDRRFLQWRFLQHPQKNYEIWGYYSKQDWDLNGYAAITIEDDGRAVIVDWLSIPEKELTGLFLTELMRIFNWRGISKLVTWFPSGCEFVDMFTASGFSIQPEPIGFIPTARSFSEELPIQWVLDNIYYTMADGDLF
jgi:hypothetical protein